MGRGRVIERALQDAVELRTLARTASDAAVRSALGEIATRRVADIGPSIPKTRAAHVLGVSLTAIDKWVERGSLPVRRAPASSREEIETRSVVDLAVEVDALRRSGLRRGLLATALARLHADKPPRPPMGTRDFFPDQIRERRHEHDLLTPGERVAQGIELSRSATRLAAAAARAKGAA